MVKGKKLAAAIIAAVCAVSILAAGTYTWFNSVHVVNEFTGNKKDVVIHDDFDAPNKDVYVENTGKATLYVRIKLSERMKLGSNARPSEVDVPWQTHVPAISLADCGNVNQDNAKFHDYFKWTLGGQKYYMPGVAQDKTEYTAGSNGVKLTPNAQVVSMADYLTRTDKATFQGWIYDADGYAYWSQPLKAGEVTGLLLNAVTPVESLKETDYYYAIDVKAEVVDYDDLPMWTEGKTSVVNSADRTDKGTANAVNFLNGIAIKPETTTAAK